MDESIRQLPLDQLRTLHREISALIAEKRSSELERLRTELSVLGFSPDDLVQKKSNGRSAAAAKYRDPESGETWTGRGQRPAWMKEALENGRQLEDLLIA